MTLVLESREERLARVVRWLLSGKSWADYISTPTHHVGTGWTVEKEAKDALIAPRTTPVSLPEGETT